MKPVGLDAQCQECMAGAVERIARIHELPEDRRQALLSEVRAMVASAPTGAVMPQVARGLGKLLHRYLGANDPFRELKVAANNRAAERLPEMREIVHLAADPFATASRFALAGNVMDFAYLGSQDLLAAGARLLDQPLGIDDTESLRLELATAREVLYLGDNAGEIWCDRLFLESFPPSAAVTFATRSAPALNDVTLVEAAETTIGELARVIPSGSDAPGTLPELLTAEARLAFEGADVVIAKGQGNFEALFGRVSRAVYFLFIVKCAHVEKIIGHPVGSGILWRWEPEATV